MNYIYALLAQRAANAAFPAIAATLAIQSAVGFLPGGAAIAGNISTPAPVTATTTTTAPAPKPPETGTAPVAALTADSIAKHMDDFYVANRGPDGLRDWSKAVTSMSLTQPHEEVAVGAGYEAYIKTLRTSYDGSLAALKAEPGAVKNNHLTVDYFKDWHEKDGRLTKNALHIIEKMGFDTKDKTPEQIIKQLTDVPVTEYSNRYARMKATDAAALAAKPELDKAPAANVAPVAAQNVNFNLGPKAEWKDGQMAEMLNGMKNGDTAKFMQWTSDSNFIINSFVKTDGKFTQVMNGENKGGGLNVDEMVARADLMRLPSTLAQKSDHYTSITKPEFSLTAPLFKGPNEWSKGWMNGEAVAFNADGKDIMGDMAKRYGDKFVNARVTPDAAADIAAQQAVTPVTPDMALHVRPNTQNTFT